MLVPARRFPTVTSVRSEALTSGITDPLSATNEAVSAAVAPVDTISSST